MLGSISERLEPKASASVFVFQLPILFIRKFKPDAAASHIDRAPQCLPTFTIHAATDALRDLEQLFLPNKIVTDRNRRRQILLEKLASPSALHLEGHVHATRWLLLCGAASAVLFAGLVWRLKGSSAQGAHFPGHAHAD